MHWDDIAHYNPQIGDILLGEDFNRAETEYVVGPNKELIYIGEEADYAVVPLPVTSLLSDPVSFYYDIGQTAILYPMIGPVHYELYGLSNIPPNAIVWYDFFTEEMVVKS